MTEQLPILYSFRRCPYAMRARLALHYSNVKCILREVALRNKPASLLEISPKGTVPVLQLIDGTIIDESLDIIYYALRQNDPDNINQISQDKKEEASRLIHRNDTEFAQLLNAYKYFERHPGKTQNEYRAQIEEEFLENYEQMLEGKDYLLKSKSAADIAIPPFIRQFAHVDRDWFFHSKYKNLIRYLNAFLQNKDFEEVIMAKHNPWTLGDEIVLF